MVASRTASLAGSLLLTAANILIPLSILVFGTGFFPYKPFLPGLAEFEPLEYGPPPKAPFDRLVFMVVDALRSPYSLIRDGGAVPFTANARSPTVTMPRIKAITTGSIPSFVDLILNFDEADTSSTLAAQDTWLSQLKAKDTGKLLMYGDDTWLKLFPETFDRHDGTSSFFVADFTEVDNNVTRHIHHELERDDWSLMVLHYLGLDHIGHKSGPRSAHMPAKQREMDGIIHQLYEALETKSHLQSTLLVLCGDHGMNDAGNHGASSPGETSPALVFLAPKLKEISSGYAAPERPKSEYDYYSMVEQSDISPTLAALLGFPISKNNLGAFIPEFLPFWPSSSDKVQILIRNARQILNVVTAAFGGELFDARAATDPCASMATDVDELACEWRSISLDAASQADAAVVDQAWLSATSAWIRKAQDLMSSMASNYDLSRLALGQALAVAAVAASLVVLGLQGFQQAGFPLPLFMLAASYGPMMFASSYVEEEHHFWYWTCTLWLAYLGIREVAKSSRLSSIASHVASLAALRLIRSWNQTGQKYAGEPDTVKTFLIPHPELLWALITLAYVVVNFQTLQSLSGMPYVLATSLLPALFLATFTFKLAFTAEDAPELVVGFARSLLDIFQGPTLILRARIVFGLLAALMGFAVYRAKSGGPRAAQSSAELSHHLCTLLAMTQSRATNIPLFLLSSIILQALQSANLSVAEITTSSIMLQHTTFFAFGGSNAISSVDLSSAYNGISGFNVVAVGVLTLVSNWAGPLFWTSATNLLLLQNRHQNQRQPQHTTTATMTKAYRSHVVLLTVFASTSVAFVMAACTALRTHLFIWTVFSPKYLYAMAWSLGQHLLVNVAFGGFLFWLGA
ncbi:alkaline phosphatase-like protein [Trichoderma citrinoviride]|uniref:GPI ethanolamine phosphate transferase 2 n=1 Tax=Trichoderma citrinoviride TaxID=58853 RepID=A0A2T4BBA9_9HYPO|nr:alkaline phosphatase-like protein [Trichoderma citrinoviride]PTB66568.1 alkaline phosphatase-like protein [Trichoderma citrinoviride]